MFKHKKTVIKMKFQILFFCFELSLLTGKSKETLCKLHYFVKMVCYPSLVLFKQSNCIDWIIIWYIGLITKKGLFWYPFCMFYLLSFGKLVVDQFKENESLNSEGQLFNHISKTNNYLLPPIKSCWAYYHYLGFSSKS